MITEKKNTTASLAQGVPRALSSRVTSGWRVRAGGGRATAAGARAQGLLGLLRGLLLGLLLELLLVGLVGVVSMFHGSS